MSTISTLPETYELPGAHMSAKRGTDPHEYQSVTFYTPQNEHTAHSAPRPGSGDTEARGVMYNDTVVRTKTFFCRYDF